MPRIPESELERLKGAVSLIRLVEASGVALTARGRDHVGRCPFHEDDTASLVVTGAKNLYHCFGCNAAGSVLDWVMKTQGVSLPHAVEVLRSDAPVAGAEKVGVSRSHARHLPSLAAANADDQALLAEVVDLYHANLKRSPEALAYLTERGLDDPELIDRFKLGYANKSLTYRLPPGHSVAGKEMRGRLRTLGVLRTSGYEHLAGCLVVPVVDELADGAVRQLYGRRIAPNNKIAPDQPRHLYLPSPLRGVWNEAALEAGPELIVTEALIDAMTFWCAGYRNVIAAYGVNGFTEDHRAALVRHGIRRVLIAYDRDTAGDNAAAALAAELMAAGVECWRVLFPKGMDANEYARKVGPPAKSLGLLLQQAEWLGKGRSPGLASGVSLAREPAARKATGPVESAEPASIEAVPDLPPIPAASSLVAEEPQSDETVSGELLMRFADERSARHWRIRGWRKNLGPEQMRVNLLVRLDSPDEAAGYHVDSLDVYGAKQRAAYIKQASIELGIAEEVLKRDLGRVLLKLEALQDAAIRQALAPKDPVPSLDAAQERAALDLLKSPDLAARIVADLERGGVVGEASNLLAGYLAAVSRKLDQPLAILIQSSSAAGKSALMEAVLSLVPPEERIQYSAMTGQSLFYLGETDLQHKILAIAEEEGVRQAAYALKLLQSDGELTIASTGKDETTGNLVTRQYRVRGPVMLMLTTTAIDVDEELMNRCLVLSVDESREQTRAIHARQRQGQTLEGLLAGAERRAVTELHQNAQRLLQPVAVVNPFANQLGFLDDKTRTRRDHMKYLTLIRSVALLHQHQRPIKTVEHGGETLSYIEATRADVLLANRIAHDVLGRSLDELPPQTRRLLSLVRAWVRGRCGALGKTQAEFRFTRKEIRAETQWGDTQLKIHLARLAELECVLVHRGPRGLTHEYELLDDGMEEGGRHLPGLIDPVPLDTDANRSALEPDRSGSGRPLAAPWSGTGRGAEPEAAPGVAGDSDESAVETPIYVNGATSSLAAHG